MSAEAEPEEGPSQWPPRPTELPTNEYFELQELELDTSSEVLPPEPPPEFTPFKLAETSVGAPHERNAEDSHADEEVPQAVPFDRRNQNGRTRWHEIFDARDEDFQRRIRERLVRGATMGAVLLIFVSLSFLPFRWLIIGYLAAVGGVMGLAAAWLSDTCQGWLLASALGSLAFLPLVHGPHWFLVAGGTMLCGWLGGMSRESARL